MGEDISSRVKWPGSALVQLRKKLGLSQADFARALSITPQRLTGWETGHFSPKIPHLVAITRIFEVTIEDLIVEFEE